MSIGELLLSLLIILVAARIGAWLAERIKQPAVLGELVAGVVVGSSVLGWVQQTDILLILAQIGAIVLLFEAGVTSDYESFMKVKLWAFIVACVGVTFPFIFGYLVSQAFGLKTIEAIFIGATLTATSVGITVRVFRDLGKIKTKEAQIVIGAAVIDDVIGLIILASVIGIITSGSVSLPSIMLIAGLAILFLFGSLLIGSLAAAPILNFIHQMRGYGLLFIFSLAFCFLLAYLSNAIGLAPIVGAFAAGLILSNTEHQEHIASRIKPFAAFFVPIFFIMMGAVVNINLFNPFDPANHTILILGLILFLVAALGKIISGFAVFDKLNKLAIGVGMIPRGEVGLIFASYGLAHKVIDQQLYVAILLVIILTTFITPPILKHLLVKRGL